MHQVPVRGETVGARIFAHRRDGDSIAKRQTANFKFVEYMHKSLPALSERIIEEILWPIPSNSAKCLKESIAGLAYLRGYAAWMRFADEKSQKLFLGCLLFRIRALGRNRPGGSVTGWKGLAGSFFDGVDGRCIGWPRFRERFLRAFLGRLRHGTSLPFITLDAGDE